MLPIIANICLTDKCNLKCKYCYNLSGRKKPRDLPTQDTINIIKKIIDNFPIGKIIFGGGETILRKDFFDIISAINLNNIYLTLTSNGTKLSHSTIELLSEHNIKEVQITIEGFQRLHDEIRGKGTFDMAINSIKKIINNGGIKCTVAIPLRREIEKKVTDLVQYLDNLGVDEIYLERIRNIDFNFPPKKRYQIYLNALSTNTKCKIHTHDPTLIPFIYRGDFDDKLSIENNLCRAGRDFIAVSPNGDISPCPMFQVKLFNILKTDDPIKSWRNHPIIKKLNSDLPIFQTCENCFFKFECKGGCLADSYTASKLTVKDPQCFLSRLKKPKPYIDNSFKIVRKGNYYLLINSIDGNILRMNKTSSEIIDAIKNGYSYNEILKQMYERYEVKKIELEKDVFSIIKMLNDTNILRWK